MKLLRRIIFTFITTLVILGLFGYLLYTNRDQIIPKNRTTSTFESRKQELLNIVSNSFIDSDINTKDLETAQLKGIISSLEDPYSTYLSKSEYDDFQNNLDEKYEGIGIGFNLRKEGYIVTKVLTNSPAEKTGIKVGDILQKVDDQDITKLDFDTIGNKIRGKSGTEVKITVLREAQLIDFSVIRAAIANDLVTLEIKDDVGIIAISSFGNNVSTKFREIGQKIQANKNIKYLVLDLRSNTGGVLKESIEIASYLQDPEEVVVIEQSKQSKIQERTTKKDFTLKDYPIVVITDRFTASASEILAGSLKDNRGIKLVGQKTFGKGVVQSLFPLSNGDTLKLTVAKWLTPNGSEINKVGLEPDVKVLEGEDSLQKAIEIVKSK